MDKQDTLQTLESGAYRRAYSDGIIDLFVGVSLCWIGAAWIWLPDFRRARRNPAGGVRPRGDVDADSFRRESSRLRSLG